MSEAIPVAPGGGRKVLDQSALAGGGLEPDVLADLEKNLAAEGVSSAAAPRPGEKVELDKADLPLELDEPPPPGPEAEPEEPAPEVKVDLSDDIPDLDAGPEEAPRRSWTLLVAIAGVALLVVMAGGLTLWHYLDDKPDPIAQAEAQPNKFTGVIPDPEAALGVEFKPFIVPLLGAGPGRILRVRVNLVTVDDEGKRILGEHIPLARDVIYRVLRDRPAGEIKTPRGRKLLQAQIKSELNQEMRQKLVHQVFFTNFVITG